MLVVEVVAAVLHEDADRADRAFADQRQVEIAARRHRRAGAGRVAADRGVAADEADDIAERIGAMPCGGEGGDRAARRAADRAPFGRIREMPAPGHLGQQLLRQHPHIGVAERVIFGRAMVRIAHSRGLGDNAQGRLPGSAEHARASAGWRLARWRSRRRAPPAHAMRHPDWSRAGRPGTPAGWAAGPGRSRPERQDPVSAHGAGKGGGAELEWPFESPRIAPGRTSESAPVRRIVARLPEIRRLRASLACQHGCASSSDDMVRLIRLSLRHAPAS